MTNEHLIEQAEKSGVLHVDAQIVTSTDISDPEDELVRRQLTSAEKDGEENTIVAKLMTFAVPVHGYFKFAPGCFDAWLADFAKMRGDNKRIPMLVNHNMSNLIGSWTEVVKAGGGLMGAGVFSSTQYAQDMRTLLLEKHIRHVSTGVRVIQSKRVEGKDDYALLVTEGELFETSITPRPANTEAKVKVVSEEKPADSAESSADEEITRVLSEIRDRGNEFRTTQLLRDIAAAGRVKSE